MEPFAFAAHDDFLNREADLARLEDWWSGRDRNALALFGRRRVGKSWLLREFAHGKPAIILVADRLAPGHQLDRFAGLLAPHLSGVRPDLPDLPTLFEVLYAIGREEETLVVIDEFPFLLPDGAKREEVLTGIQAVMEERDASKLKLVLCGSHLGQMQTLLSEESPLRGRLTALPVRPMRFREAQAFLRASVDAVGRIERYAVTGGMSLYLDVLARSRGLKPEICKQVLDSRGPLFNDPREILEEELAKPGVYFSLLEVLASGESDIARLGSVLGRRSADLSQYLDNLAEMEIVRKVSPVIGDAVLRHRLDESFMRFWFRFVFPYQDDLLTGLRPPDLYAAEIEPQLADHVAPVFESLCREWARSALAGRATRVGSWWGKALNEHRRDGSRETEEVDLVGVRSGSVTVIGECKWTRKQMEGNVLSDLERFKIPAMRQAGIRFAKGGPQLLLFSRSGFKHALYKASEERDDIRLVDVKEVVAGLTAADE